MGKTLPDKIEFEIKILGRHTKAKATLNPPSGPYLFRGKMPALLFRPCITKLVEGKKAYIVSRTDFAAWKKDRSGRQKWSKKKWEKWRIQKRQEEGEWEKWRWEFMRESKEIITVYEEILDLRKRAEYPQEYSEKKENIVDYPYWRTPEGEKERKYSAEYGFRSSFFPDPSKSFEELVESEMEWDSKAECYKVSKLRIPRGFIFNFNAINRQAVSLSMDPKEKTKVQIMIDFEKVNTLQALQEVVSELIEKHVDMLPEEQITRLRKKKESGKKDFNKILEMGRQIINLRSSRKNNEYWSDDAIAAELSETLDQRIQGRTVTNWRNQYEELINGGWRDITFP